MPRNINGVILKPVVLLGADGEEITDEEAVTRRDEAASYIQECRSKKHQVRRKGKGGRGERSRSEGGSLHEHLGSWAAALRGRRRVGSEQG